jgi:hypothetical protein
MNNENYAKNPEQKVSYLLNKFGWRRISRGLWEKNTLRLLVDGVGIFLFQWINTKWVRTHGASHNLLKGAEFRLPDGGALNLAEGEFLKRGNRR